MKLKILSFRDRFDILLETKPSGVAELISKMCVPDKANIGKLGNPAWLRTNIVKMQRRQFIKRAIGISAMAKPPFQAAEFLAAKTGKEKKGKKKKDGLAGNLKLLNQWGEQPATIQRLYEAAFKVLEAKPNATYADVAADSEVRSYIPLDSGRRHNYP